MHLFHHFRDHHGRFSLGSGEPFAVPRKIRREKGPGKAHGRGKKRRLPAPYTLLPRGPARILSRSFTPVILKDE